MSIIYHDLIQGTDEWMAARCGLLTASEMKLIITPTLKTANNDKSRTHLYELLGQRMTKFVEPTFVSYAMERGQNDEATARWHYSENIAEVTQTGFITNDKWGFTLGFSPDGLVGDDGAIECKSRMQKYQVETILARDMPKDFMIQVQTGLLVSEREWCDFISYSGGMPMCIVRVHPDEKVQAAIIDAATTFEADMGAKITDYAAALEEMKAAGRYIETEREEEDIRV